MPAEGFQLPSVYGKKLQRDAEMKLKSSGSFHQSWQAVFSDTPKDGVFSEDGDFSEDGSLQPSLLVSSLTFRKSGEKITNSMESLGTGYKH